jgi:integrase
MKAKTLKPEIITVGNFKVRIYKGERKIKHKTYRSFAVADFTTGRRVFRSFSTLEKARNEALRIGRQLNSGNHEAAAMRSSDAASYGRAIELLRPTGVSLELAAASFAKAFQILGNDSLIEAAQFYRRHNANLVTHKRVSDVADELVATKLARGKSTRYVGGLRARLKKFSDTFQMNISSVTTADVQKYLDGLKLAPQTVKNFRTVIGTLFSFAESRGYVHKGGNVVEATENISVNGGNIEIFSPSEISALLKSASQEFLPFLALGAFAGLRSAEIERLEWSEIDLAGGFIHIAAANAKTRSRRLVPVLPNLTQWLAAYATHTGKVWKRTSNDLQDARAATVKASGVAWKDNGLRHSFISYRLADIQNAAQVALEAGNSPNVVFKHYREIVRPSVAKEWFAIAPEMAANVTSLAAAVRGA